MTDAMAALRRWVRIPRSIGRILFVLVAVIAIFSVISPGHIFWSRANAQNIGLASAEILVLACGMTVVIICGQIDLSVGSQLLVSAIVGASFLQHLGGATASWSQILIGLAVMIGIGALFGLVNGLLTVALRVPSFITTLGTFGAGLGVAQLLTAAGGSSSDPAPNRLGDFGLSQIAGVPSIVVVAVVIAVAISVALRTTRFGLRCYATGSNQENARRSGVRVNGLIVGVFVLMGVLSAVAGFIDLARFSAVSTTTHQSDNLTAIAAVIIGGASLFGGRGTIFGTIVGTLVPVVLLQGFVIQDVNPYWQNVAIGGVLVAAVAFDGYDRGAARLTFLRRRHPAASFRSRTATSGRP